MIRSLRLSSPVMFSIKYSKQFLSYRILKSNRFKYIWRYELGLLRGCAQGGVCVYCTAVGLSYLRCSESQGRVSCPSKTWKVLYQSPMAGSLFTAARAWGSTATTTTINFSQTRCHRKSLVRRIFRGQGGWYVVRAWERKLLQKKLNLRRMVSLPKRFWNQE